MESVFIPYRERDHGNFDEEWPIQRKASGWWYVTGILAETARPETLWTYQFTVARAHAWGLKAWWMQTALTEIATGRHACLQRVLFREAGDVYVTTDTVRFRDMARLMRDESSMSLHQRGPSFQLDLVLDKGKGAVWHGDDGVLVMGSERPECNRTVYYSYPHMPTTGRLVLPDAHGRERVLQVSGRSWFDRQWGTYCRRAVRLCPWEWLSLRFFDDEEVMLFLFPQTSSQDGTYIPKDGPARRLGDFTCTPTGFRRVEGRTYSTGWDLTMPGIKEERYGIRPLTDSQYNLFYVEALAGIYDAAGTRVGLCMVELIPGARNRRDRMNPFSAFRKANADPFRGG